MEAAAKRARATSVECREALAALLKKVEADFDEEIFLRIHEIHAEYMEVSAERDEARDEIEELQAEFGEDFSLYSNEALAKHKQAGYKVMNANAKCKQLIAEVEKAIHPVNSKKARTGSVEAREAPGGRTGGEVTS